MSAEFNVPTCGHIGVCQPCRDRQIQSLFPTSSLFSRKVIFAGLLRKAFPRKQACRHQCFSAVAEATRQDSPRPVQGQIMQEGARGSARHIVYSMYTALYTYHHRSATDLLMPASARRASARGFVHLQTNCAFRRRAGC